MLVNQRLSMNLRLALSCLFLGVLTAFMVWSIQWVLESRKEVTFDMPGDVTVLNLGGGPQIVPVADAASAQEELKAYLRDRSLALVVSSNGEGRPEVLVYDPQGLLSWFPRASREDMSTTMSGAYLFKGTYSERRWSESTATPFLPKGVAVEGVIDVPSRAGILGTLQYARVIGQDPLPPASYTINTIDPDQVRHVLDLLHRIGLAAQGAKRIPLLGSLILNPLFIVTGLFLVLGHVCAVLYWALYLHGRAYEFGVRSRHGARPMGLVRENLAGGLPGLVAGSVVGVILSGVLVAAIGHAPLASGNFQTLAVGALVAVAVATVTWSTTLYAVIRLRYEANLVA